MNTLIITTETTSDAASPGTAFPFNTSGTVACNSYVENTRTVGTTFEQLHSIGQEDPTPSVAIIINEGDVDAIVGMDYITSFVTNALPPDGYFIIQQFNSELWPYNSLSARSFTGTCKLRIILIS